MNVWKTWREQTPRLVKAEEAIIPLMICMKELGWALIEGTQDPERGLELLLEARQQLAGVDARSESSRIELRRVEGEIELLLGLKAEEEGRKEDAREHFETGLSLQDLPQSEREEELHRRAEMFLKDKSRVEFPR